MGFDWRARLPRLPILDLRRPRVAVALAGAALAVAAGGFLLGALAGSAQAERSALAELRGWAAQLVQQRQAVATTRAALGDPLRGHRDHAALGGEHDEPVGGDRPARGAPGAARR